MAPLGDGARSSLRAVFSRQYGRHGVKDDVISTLVDYFGGRGEDVRSIPLDVDVEDVDMWKEEWEVLLEDAKIESEVDRRRVVNWLIIRSRAPAKSDGVGGGVARQALKILDAHGVVVTSEVERELTKMVAVGSAGDELTQSTCAACVGILYTGSGVSAEDLVIWEQRREALQLGGGTGGTIALSDLPQYAKTLKNTNVIVLERALKKSTLWDDYCMKVSVALGAASLPKAAERFSKVLAKARKHATSSAGIFSWAAFAAYLPASGSSAVRRSRGGLDERPGALRPLEIRLG